MSPMRARLVGRRGIAGVLAGGLMVSLAGCGDSSSSGTGEPETVVDDVDLSGVEISVGSKDFTEQLILGQITIQVLQAAGATVEDRTGAGSTRAVRESLEAGATDMYWEYTGTGWLEILGHQQPVAGAQAQYDSVAEEDLQANGIRWLPPAPADNTYAIAVSEQAPSDGAGGVATLSDFGALVQQSPELATLCVASEFVERSDGLPGLEQAYGFGVPPDNLVTVDQEGLVYAAINQGQACAFGEVFRTDGRIASLDLRLLEDDKGFFPVYNPALTVRAELVDQYPELEAIFAEIASTLDAETLRELNTSVDVDDRPVRDVAQEFLEDEELLSPQQLTK